MPWFKVTAVEDQEDYGGIVTTACGRTLFYTDAGPEDIWIGDFEAVDLHVFADEHGEIVGTNVAGNGRRYITWRDHPRSDDPVRDAAYIAAHADALTKQADAMVKQADAMAKQAGAMADLACSMELLAEVHTAIAKPLKEQSKN